MGPFEEVFPEFTTRGEDYTKVALIGITISTNVANLL